MGAAFKLVPRYSVATRLDNCGDPGRQVMEKVEEPALKHMTVRCLGRLAFFNIVYRIGAAA